MIDVHCHILPGIDDGPDTMEESLRMAEAAISDGITHVVATPHASSDFGFDYSRVRQLRDQLQAEVGDRLKLATGCDFHVSPENLNALHSDRARFCINQRNCLLVEFNEYSIPNSMDQTLHEMQLQGICPIITHPERNRILCSHPERLANWARLGCGVQITGGSLTGMFGGTARERAMSWIGRGMVHIVASDAHNTTRRPLQLRPAYNAVAENFGRQVAEALFVENPLAAFEGRQLPYVPEITEERSRRKRFLFF